MNTIIVFASMTGTTERMAHTIASELKKAGDQVVVRDAIEAYAEELKAYKRILLGSYTWGDGEVSDEMIGFLDELAGIDLSGKIAAVFGPGDSTYDHFARGVDILEESLKKQDCKIILDGLKVDSWNQDEEEIIAKCKAFAGELINLSHHVNIA